MPGMDRNLVLEALSALTGATVKPLADRKAREITNKLTVENFISTVLMKALTGDGEMTVSELLAGLKVSASEISALRNELFVDMEEFFDPGFDYDFRALTDSSKCSRGGEPYMRPVGWYRFALKVKDKYPDGNAWLGSAHWRSHSEAEGYAMTKTFTSKKTGKTYKVIMQNRINPQKRKIITQKNFWLIPVPEGSTAEQEKQIVKSSIRPYGILIQEVTQ
ncbi:uncharacterized protein LOC132884235 [Neoarius graeffei]|uniref:uncharacterized protein LOC132884235 n=1 Tax=Neoarius graeffei TaxID=443677 RepID=UPI00298C743E|nr:uncharacterized protein LOC132884235 [Neoarius graeffei]